MPRTLSAQGLDPLLASCEQHVGAATVPGLVALVAQLVAIVLTQRTFDAPRRHGFTATSRPPRMPRLPELIARCR